MPPSFAVVFVFERRVLGVVDEHVRPGGELTYVAVVFWGTGLIVGGIDNGAISCLHPKAKAALRVIQRESLYHSIADFEAIPWNPPETPLRLHGGHADG